MAATSSHDNPLASDALVNLGHAAVFEGQLGDQQGHCEPDAGQ